MSSWLLSMACPSQLFVLKEFIDKSACACQAVIMMKTHGNLVLFIWSKFNVTSNLAAENLVFRHQLAVMKRTNKRPKIQRADRLFWLLLSRIWSPWRKSLVIVKPETVVRWRRKGFELYWKFKSKGPEKPRSGCEIRHLVRKMTIDNRARVCPEFMGNCSGWVSIFLKEPYLT